MGGLGARAPGTGGGARAGPSGATQGPENECERGARLSALQKSHSAKNIRFPMPACRRTPRELVLGTSAKMKTSHASRKIALCTSSLGIAGTSSSDHVPTTCRGVRISRVVPQLEEGDDVLVEEILSRRRSGRYQPRKRMPGDRCRADQTTRTDHPR